jgi:hypothetical protein
MYITDLTHFLDGSGAIAPIKERAARDGQFVVEVVAHATDESDTAPAAPTCFKCKKGPVTAVRARMMPLFGSARSARRRAGSRSGRGRSGT